MRSAHTSAEEERACWRTTFSFAQASASQMIAFFGGAVVTIAFFVWVAYLVRH